MIHVVTSANRSLYAETIAQMHQLRKVHFVDERGWSAMSVRDGGEYDAYDDEQAIYLLAIEPNGAISCSMRMRPAATGSILADVFPHLVAADEAPLAATDTWEISRYFASPAGRGRSGVKRRAEIRQAALEVALQHKVKRLIGMIDIEFLPPMLNGSGWQVRTLGLPAPYDEGVAQAIEVHVSSSALADFEESQGLAAPLSFELDTSVVPHLPPAEIEALLTVAASDDNGRAVLLRLTRHLAGLDETTTEEELLALVEYVAGLVERGQAVTT
jgi:acyl-homoserine lactone synthase